ncbi:MAG: class I SAM-dependent methyltransferase [Nitriliruptoraceae bacterium]
MTKPSHTDREPAPVRRSHRQAQRTYDRLSGAYDLLEAPFERPVRRTARRLLGATPGERILEIGCGTGEDLAAYARSVGRDGWCLGVDLAPGMLRRSAQRLTRDGLADRVSLLQADGLQLPLAERSFDAVYLSFTLELFDTPELEPLLAQCRRVLRDPGRLVVVSLAQVADPPVLARLYVAARRALPAVLDCRPIPTARWLHAAGFAIDGHLRRSVWGMPVDVVLARPRDQRRTC